MGVDDFSHVERYTDDYNLRRDLSEDLKIFKAKDFLKTSVKKTGDDGWCDNSMGEIAHESK